MVENDPYLVDKFFAVGQLAKQYLEQQVIGQHLSHRWRNPKTKFDGYPRR